MRCCRVECCELALLRCRHLGPDHVWGRAMHAFAKLQSLHVNMGHYGACVSRFKLRYMHNYIITYMRMCVWVCACIYKYTCVSIYIYTYLWFIHLFIHFFNLLIIYVYMFSGTKSLSIIVESVCQASGSVPSLPCYPHLTFIDMILQLCPFKLQLSLSYFEVYFNSYILLLKLPHSHHPIVHPSYCIIIVLWYTIHIYIYILSLLWYPTFIRYIYIYIIHIFKYHVATDCPFIHDN